MISITGEPGGSGVRAGVSIADITAGMYAAFGILAALHARQHTGRGQFIDVSMLEGQLGILSGMVGAYVADGIVPGPLGTAYGALLPYQTFHTKTRDIAIGIGSDKLWRTFCAAACRHSDGCNQHHRSGGRARASAGTRRAGTEHPSSGRHDSNDRAAGTIVGDARRRQDTGAAPRRTYGTGTARAPRDGVGGDCAFEGFARNRRVLVRADACPPLQIPGRHIGRPLHEEPTWVCSISVSPS